MRCVASWVSPSIELPHSPIIAMGGYLQEWSVEFCFRPTL